MTEFLNSKGEASLTSELLGPTKRNFQQSEASLEQFQKISQQLQVQIKKNKNLLQTNFTLMEQNQQYSTGFTKLKNHLTFTENECEQSVMVDDVEELVNAIIEKLNIQSNYSQTLSNNRNRDLDVPKNCECSKWKQLYLKESEQSFRLSNSINQLHETIEKMRNIVNEDRKQIQLIMDQYLKLFKRVNSVEFLKNESTLSQNVEIIKQRELKKSKQNSNRNQSSSAHKKQNSSKPKNNKTKKSEAQTPFDNNYVTNKLQVPKNCSQNQYLVHLSKFCEKIMKENSDHHNQISKLMEEVDNREILLRIYRERERNECLRSYNGQYLNDL